MDFINRVLKILFFFLIVRPLVLIYIGLNVRNRERLPKKGPALLIANHNSHLDTMVLMSLFPLQKLSLLRPAAAADYFLKTGFRAWFSREIIGIIPIVRKSDPEKKISASEVLRPVTRALDAGQIVIFFPEGTRGEAERLGVFKKGIGLLARDNPGTPITPIYLHGLGKALPRGEALLVPFFCDVFVGEPISGGEDDPSAITERVRALILELAKSCPQAELEKEEDLYF